MSEGALALTCPDMTCADGSVPTPMGSGLCQCVEEDTFADPIPPPQGPVDSFSAEDDGESFGGGGGDYSGNPSDF